MKSKLFTFLAIHLTAAWILASGPLLGQEKGSSVKTTESALLQPWTGPYGGVPPWHLVRADEFVAAFDAAIATAEQEIEVIANNAQPATFENTVVALEKAGKSLSRINAIFGVYSSNLNTGPIPDIERVVVPKLLASSFALAHSSSVRQI